MQQFTADTKEKAEELRLKFLSRKGILNEIFAEFKNVAPTEKREYGQRINALKQLVEKKINEAQEKFEEQASKPNDLDITLPGPNYSLGSHHPITNVLNEIIEIFSRLGFTVAEGQEIVVALKDLYIGGYRKQPEIGQPYNGSSIGRMNKELFQQHYKYVGTPDVTKLDTLDFDIDMDKDANCAKLVVLKNVSFVPVGGLGTFAPDTTQDKTVSIVGGCVNRALNEYSESKLVVRTSTYAKFAAMKLPYDEVNKKPLKCNLTGIATRYNNTWQILIRKESDIQVIDN